ncbi:MAG: ROK family protein [Gaiellaceae bacterium]
MSATLTQSVPHIVPPLDPGFRPAILANRAFREAVRRSGHGTPLRIALERGDDLVTIFDTEVYEERSHRLEENLSHVERLLKTLLWARGGFRATIGGSAAIAEHLQATYAPGGEREFDYRFFSEEVYERPLQIVSCPFEDAPVQCEAPVALGRHLDGCRIGLDLGGSDRKVSAVIDGEPVYSEEVVWHPKTSSDPRYHIEGIEAALRSAAGHLPRVDAIGVSAAGIYVDNRARVASLFRLIPRDEFAARITNLFIEIGERWGVPIEVANDGDVTALAGSMSLGATSVLGIAMGTSEAAGYVDRRGSISGWLNELAFVPVDVSTQAPVDTEWSQDRGTGVLYFSQDAVSRYCDRAGVVLEGEDPEEKLAWAQELMKRGDGRVERVFETIGVCFGYGLAHYADFYDIAEVLVLGRVTSERGGDIIVEQARRVLAAEFPELAETIRVELPDEKSKRVGQSIAAASLPAPLDSEGKAHLQREK